MKPGIYEDLSAEEYHALDNISSGFLQAYRKGPPKEAITPKQQTPQMETGTEIHGGFLSGWGQGQMKKQNWDRYFNLVISLASGECEIARKLITHGKSEISLIWKDDKTGLPCKARLDLLVDEVKTIADIKTTTNPHPESWLRTSMNSGAYPHYQAHWYLRGAKALGLDVHAFCWVLMQTRPPWLITVAEAIPEMVYAAELGINKILPQIAHCRETGIWPGYPDEIVKLDLPMWFYKREEF